MIETLAQLRSLYAAPLERSQLKQLNHVDAHARRFIQRSPLCVLASAGAEGRLLDASPRGGEAGFVKVLDDRTLLLPDAGGNNRLDTLENLLVDPRLSLIFFVPGVQETLRVNGRARLRDEAEFLDRFARERQRPKLVIQIEVQELYLHCAKAFMRSRLWDSSTWPERTGLPSMNQMIRDQLSAQGLTPPALESEAATQARYRAQLAQEATPEQE
jgi:PPOX class probable FMN-dependent enzyme